MTHLLASWCFAEFSGLDRRERAVVTWVGVAPDLDGLGVLVDWTAILIGAENPGLYYRFHHTLLHGLPGALALGTVGAALTQQRWKTFLAGFAVVHLHLLCDLVGSRGPTLTDLWPIHYLAPFSESLTWVWSGQWPLNGWPNFLVTLSLLGVVIGRAATCGHSPFALFSSRAHEAFVGLVQRGCAAASRLR